MNGSIFVQVAAYRDPELLPTLRDCVEKARHPERLAFGVCYQARGQTKEHEALLRFPNCRVAHMEPESAKGTCAARAVTQTLWRGEAYTLQIDSHARFVPGWDEILLDMHSACGDKAILTAYCPAYAPNAPLDAHPVAHTLGADYFNAYGSLMLAARMPLDGMPRPVPGAFWSGHFSFASARVIADIPYDPSLYFHGEEISYAARAWTRGYDLYYPNRAVCYHFYARAGRHTHWGDQPNWRSRDMLSQQRVRRMLGIEENREDFGRYGLGDERSLEAYERWSGVDFAAMRFSAKAWNGWYSGAYPRQAIATAQEAPPRQSILFATAFRDTGRDKWLAFRRDKALYLEWFANLAALKKLELVCYYPKAQWAELPPGAYRLRDFDPDDTFFRAYFEAEQAIMRLPSFRAFIGERGQNPEHCHPEYSMMTHAKANFVRRAAAQFPEYSHYAWIDFGIARRPFDPDTALDWRRLMDDKVHMQAFAPPGSFPTDPRELCRESPDALSASLFVVPKHHAIWYESVYEQELQRNHALQIADDEQNIMLRLAQQYPDKISADIVDGWYSFFENAMRSAPHDASGEHPIDRSPNA